MAFRDMYIRKDDDTLVQCKVPILTSELKPKYPETWFDNHPGQKPLLRVPKLKFSHEELLRRMGIVWNTESEIEPTIAFLHDYIKRKFVDKLQEDWISYDRIIGRKGETVTPLDLLEVEFYDTELHSKSGNLLDPSEENARAATIFSIYRAHTSSQAPDVYQERILETMKLTLREPPYCLYNVDSAVILAKTSWGNNDSFKKIIAAVDMFFNKFRENPFARIKVATLSSRDRDCGALNAVLDLGRYLGLPPESAIMYAMDGRIAEELIRLSKEVEEAEREHSYFHYMRDMGFSSKSPYSSRSRRALNARLFSDAGFYRRMNRNTPQANGRKPLDPSRRRPVVLDDALVSC